ncbi:MAG: CoA pyrophosphatase [Saprospiraceae bacterium]|nr:CoA pyrophosphatase [Saprospiraceae bacterium]
MIDIDLLQKRLRQPLPGWYAQRNMAASQMRSISPIAPPQDAKQSAVLFTLFEKNSDWFTLLIERTQRNVSDKHSGQISFPGGKRDMADNSLQATAIRETWEEIGLMISEKEILGALTPLYIPVSNFWVQPFLAHIIIPQTFTIQPTEVVQVLEVKLDDLLDSNNLRLKDVQVGSGFQLKNVPHFMVNGVAVWGATAMMINELLTLLKQPVSSDDEL